VVNITLRTGGKFRFQRVPRRGRRVRPGSVCYSFVAGSPFLYCFWTYIYVQRSQLEISGLVL